MWYYYIPEKYPYTLPLEWSCNKSLYMYWNDDLSFVTLWPRRSFSANSKGMCAVCLHNSIVCLGCVTKVLEHLFATCPTGMKRKKHWEPCHVKMGLSCVKYDLISCITFAKSKAVGTRYIIIVLSHLFNDLFLHGPTAAFWLTGLSECMHLLVHTKINHLTYAITLNYLILVSKYRYMCYLLNHCKKICI